MKKLLALLLALVMVLSFAACNNNEQPEESQSEPQSGSENQSDVEEPFVAVHAERDDWNDEVKNAINALVDTYGKASENYADP